MGGGAGRQPVPSNLEKPPTDGRFSVEMSASAKIFGAAGNIEEVASVEKASLWRYASTRPSLTRAIIRNQALQSPIAKAHPNSSTPINQPAFQRKRIRTGKTCRSFAACARLPQAPRLFTLAASNPAQRSPTPSHERILSIYGAADSIGPHTAMPMTVIGGSSTLCIKNRLFFTPQSQRLPTPFACAPTVAPCTFSRAPNSALVGSARLPIRSRTATPQRNLPLHRLVQRLGQLAHCHLPSETYSSAPFACALARAPASAKRRRPSSVSSGNTRVISLE